MNATAILQNVKQVGWRGMGAPLLLMMMLAMVVLPLPPVALDMLFTFNIALSLIVLLVVLYTLRPLDFGVFPSLLLVATLLRLALNVASTRVVLLEGHNGGDAAGKVIEAFGEFVIGGNYAVGLVVFAILVIINFVVVTKGAGRVSEVSARFTLDAMPGKQMAIDADLNAGLISQDEARTRREEVSKEADFYGAMDGSSKFVRGDAIAGLLILFINIIGGLGIGVLQHDLDFGTALQNYTLLTIGDGLVAQIPSLLLSTSAAIIVTRVASTEDMGTQVVGQLLNNPKALAVTAGVLGVLGMIPGMPNMAFLLLAFACAGGAWWIHYGQRKRTQPTEPHLTQVKSEQPELGWDDVQLIDTIEVEVGYRLIPIADPRQGGTLKNKIKGVRRELSRKLGFLIQAVHIRDNLDQLSPNGYRINVRGVNVGEGEIHPDRVLAIYSERVFGKLDGIDTKDPAFGIDAVWIDPEQREHAQTLGYTVVDPSSVVATHLSQLLHEHAHQLLGHEEVQKLLDILADTTPKLVEDLVPKVLSLGVVLKVLQNLLEERIPIRDIRSIAETLAEHAQRSQDPGVLTAAVRVALSRSIVQQLIEHKEEIKVNILDPELEQLLLQMIQTAEEGQAGFEPGLAERLQQELVRASEAQEMDSQEGVLLVAAPLRAWMAKFVRQVASGMHVLSYHEIPDNRKIQVVRRIGSGD